MRANQLKGYTENSVLSAEPTRLTMLLYQGALKFIRAAEAALDDKSVEDAHVAILRAHGIISELMATLDFERGGDIAANLERLYDYSLRELIEADIKKDKEHLLKAIRVIEPLADAWEEAFFKKPVIKSIAPPSNSKIAGTYNFVSGNSIAGNISAELKLPVQQKPTENPENPTLPPKLKMDLKG